MCQLVHMHGVTQREIASLWKWHESRVSRHIKRAEEKLPTLPCARSRRLILTWNLDGRTLSNFVAALRSSGGSPPECGSVACGFRALFRTHRQARSQVGIPQLTLTAERVF